jgi:hypothetical protein
LIQGSQNQIRLGERGTSDKTASKEFMKKRKKWLGWEDAKDAPSLKSVTYSRNLKNSNPPCTVCAHLTVLPPVDFHPQEAPEGVDLSRLEYSYRDGLSGRLNLSIVRGRYMVKTPDTVHYAL